MADQATLQIPQDILRPLIEAKVHESLAGALGDQSGILRRVVDAVINVKVDSEGKVDTYGSSRGYTFIQWLVEDCLKKAVRKAIESELEKHQEIIKAALIAEFRKKNSPLIKQLVEQMATGMTAAVANKYRFNVTVGE